jgi:superfamily I DNA/RNA helicase
MTDELQAEARAILASLPWSIEMPAGTGKTHLIVAMTAEAATNGDRALILTHTNAGVDALRKRLAKHQVDPKSYHVDTITGWALDLVRHYPSLSQMTVPAMVDPNDSGLYVVGSTRVAQATALIRMHRSSFQYLFVDEYQDCVVEHHDLVVALADAIPQCAVLGDPLQGIFDFRDSNLVDWPTHVHPRFPVYTRSHTPWRWSDHNDELGQWLIDIRARMAPDGTLDLSKVQIPGFEWKPAGAQSEIQAAYAAANRGGSVVILHAQRNQHKTVGRAAKGMYSIMESVHGNYMHDQLRKLDQLGPAGCAKWLAETAKACFSGLGDINNPVFGRLERNQTLTSLSRPTVARTVEIIEAVREQPTLATLSQAMYLLVTEGEGTCYAHEAWFDMAKSLERASIDETRDPNEHLAVIRNRLRYAGRRSRDKLLSKTLLVKGLEYDHTVIANADTIGNHKHLYVAMTRPRKTLTILSASPIIRLI